MSSDVTPPPNATPTADAPVADFVAANRQPTAYVLLALGLICLIVAGYLFYQALGRPAPKDQSAEAKPTEPGTENVRPVVPHQAEYVLGGVGGLAAALALGGVGVWLLAAVPRPTTAGERTSARLAVLAAGGLFGLVLMVMGVVFFALWFKSLTAWLDTGKASEAKWVLGPLLAVLVGAGLVFASAQPARAEERNNSLLRRLVYGANLVLTGMLVLVLLIAGNVFAALKVPNKLDTTESGFYTLSDKTREYIAGLEQPVKVYTTLFEDLPNRPRLGRIMRDMRQLLAACQEANPSKFQVRYLSLTLNKDEITALKNKYPQADLNEIGVLVVVGEDEKRYSFIRYDDLYTAEGGGAPGEEPNLVFQGESRLVRELLFLSENKTRPVVYFTQNSGELAIGPRPGGEGGPTPPARSANQIKTALEKNYVDVRPLTLDVTDPKIPDDATVVAVADPVTALSPEQVTALRKYMSTPRADGKKGKLIVLAGPHRKPTGGMAPTGLEDLLAEYGVQLGTRWLYGDPRFERIPADTAIVGVPDSLAEDRTNTLAVAYAGETGILPWRNCRTLEVARGGGGPYQPQGLFFTIGNRATWLEDDPPPDPNKAFSELMVRDAAELRKKKAFGLASRPVAATVTEGGTSRVAVFGCGDFFSDETGRRLQGAQLQADLFVTSVDWLRDRPAVAAVATKQYSRYTLTPKVDEVRLAWLPGGVAVLAILALGAGVWVLRRQ